METVEELTESLTATRRALLLTTNALTHERAVIRPADGEWSVLEVLAHLIDCDYHYAAEALAMRDQRDHMLKHFDDEAWKAGHSDVRDTPLAGILAKLAASHAFVLRLLASMSDTDLDWPGLHPRGIPYSVRNVFLRWPQHEENHKRQITEILATIASEA